MRPATSAAGVILSEAKDLVLLGGEILRFAQDDKPFQDDTLRQDDKPLTLSLTRYW